MEMAFGENMESAKLIKSLESKGFFLEFPEYDSLEDEIVEIIKGANPRIISSLPILLKEDIDYKKICSKLNRAEKKELDKAIAISEKIYRNESIKNSLRKIIKENSIKTKFSKQEFDDFYNAFKEARLNAEANQNKKLEKQAKLRLNLSLNKDLKTLFSPAKISIMEKIFNHEKLTNTELKYYYKAISNINKSVLNPVLQNYLMVIEMAKKHS